MTRLPLGKRVVVGFLCLIVLPFLVATGCQGIRFSNALRENMYASMRQTSRQYAVQLSAKLAQAESFINQLRLDENLRQAITEIDA